MLALIAALSKNYVIGNNGIIPWKVKGEQKRFKELTTGKIVIMGKRSFEEIGRPLPNRRTIVISTSAKFEYDNCITLGSLAEALEYVGTEDAFIAGGERLYREALPLADILYLTMLELEVCGDTYFPEFRKEDFDLVEEEDHEGEVPYRYLTYRRKSDRACGSPGLDARNKEYIGKQGEVALRYAILEDAKLLCRWWNDGRVMAHAGFPNGLNTTQEAIQEQIAGENRERRRVILEIGPVMAGEMSYRILGTSAEIGIKICESSYQGQGYGTTALRLLIEYLFTNEEINKIILDTNLKNTRAQHVYEKIGFKKKELHMDAWRDQLGQLQSSVDYELERENYYS